MQITDFSLRNWMIMITCIGILSSLVYVISKSKSSILIVFSALIYLSSLAFIYLKIDSVKFIFLYQFSPSLLIGLTIFFLLKPAQKDPIWDIEFRTNNRGDLIPLSLVDEQRDKIKVVQSNAEYFAKQLYELDQYNLKDKKEKLLWLIDKQPTAIIKDKERKNYYSNFLSINGLIQKVEIVPDSWEITQVEDNPLVNFSVIIKRINGNNEEFFKADIKLRMTKVHINYPFNPFGFLITNFEESLSRIEKPSDEEKQSLDSLKINQPKPLVQ